MTLQQSILDPASPQAAAIHGLARFMFVVGALVYAAVMIAFILVVRRGATIDDDRTPDREAAARRGVIVAAGFTGVILFVLLVYDFTVGRGLMHASSPAPLSITVTGHQWWWDVEYADPVPQNRVHTANEIHVPVGRLVHIRLVSHDVIHSFWVPNLGGKKDLIPGHTNEITFLADRPGVYRGQCAEFCGMEHAKMAILVIADPADKFAAWAAAQRLPASIPTDSLALKGKLIFEAGPCALCHTIAATRAAARVGPDLTHLISRSTIAAGTLPNNIGNLAGWILDPQTIKPGAQMPATALSGPDLRALLAYLETLR